MCRNIRVLHHFEPPSTPEEIRAAAEQYIRKVAGLTKPRGRASGDDEVSRAVDAVTRATERLLEKLPKRGSARTREGERERARARWMSREARILDKARPEPARKSSKSGKPGKTSRKAAAEPPRR